jgi:hypothetical protein
LASRENRGGGEEKMKTAKSNRDEVRENNLSIPMNKEEKQKIREAAENMGVPMSTFARMVIKDFLKNASN